MFGSYDFLRKEILNQFEYYRLKHSFYPTWTFDYAQPIIFVRNDITKKIINIRATIKQFRFIFFLYLVY